MSISVSCGGGCPPNLTGIEHLPECAAYKAEPGQTKERPDLKALVEKVQKLRGTHKSWFKRYLQLSVFILAQPDTTRFWCRGEVRHPIDGHHPAVLFFADGEPQVWAAHDPDKNIVSRWKLEDFFGNENIKAHLVETSNPETTAVTKQPGSTDHDNIYLGGNPPKVSNLCSEIPRFLCSKCGSPDIMLCDCSLPGLVK